MSSPDVKAIVNDPLANTPPEPKGFLKQKRQTVYVTSNGMEYLDRKVALLAQRELNAKEFCQRYGDGEGVHYANIVENWDELKKAMGS